MHLPDYSAAKVLVVGDLMLDRYWHGETSRISPEAPVPVVHVSTVEDRPGGAGNVALNIAALGAKAFLFGYCGRDEAAELLIDSLESVGVWCKFQQFDDLSTITKLRVLSRHQQLIRLDLEDGFHDVPDDSLLEDLCSSMSQVGVVALSDYGKGTLGGVQRIIDAAKEAGKMILVDPKGNDFSIYRRATVITPNLAEFEAVVGSCANESELEKKAMDLIGKLELTALLVTRGEHGMSLISRQQKPLHLPTEAREVYDVTGAGDTVISVLAASLAANKSLYEATELANLGAGIVVGKLGTATVNQDELNEALQGKPAHQRGVIRLPDLLITLARARSNGEKIVATNGCFDILHPGHLHYLKEARALGDRLVVLVNNDKSVGRLKGAGRPVNPLAFRMEMLAALECVDWVIAFDEGTPSRLISEILPDILVKGGDYKDIKAIAGYDHVVENGGEVKILSYISGLSSTGIIESIQRGDDEAN